MRKSMLALSLLTVVTLAFFTGRITNSAPVYEPGELSESDPLPQAFEEFITAQQNAVALFRNSAFFDDEQDRAEAYRGFLYSLVGAIKVGALTQGPGNP